MTEYALYLESGPRHRTTMVHVLELLGCIARGPTTEEALEATPAAIRTFLRFLARHGEAADPAAPFTTAVAQHVTAGSWIGYGDPAPGFPPDFEPLSEDDLALYLHRLAGMRSDLLALIGELPSGQLTAEPDVRGRPIFRILEHIAGAQCGYLRYAVGKVDGLTDALHAVAAGPDNVEAALARLWDLSAARLQAMSETERTQQVPHGQLTWTARRGLRRMLEHDWEHLQEISERLAGSA